MKKLHFQLSDEWKKKIRFSTLSFLFIIAYVNIFPMLFGAENNIVAVIFTILMSASMVRDLTGILNAPFLYSGVCTRLDEYRCLSCEHITTDDILTHQSHNAIYYPIRIYL